MAVSVLIRVVWLPRENFSTGICNEDMPGGYLRSLRTSERPELSKAIPLRTTSLTWVEGGWGCVGRGGLETGFKFGRIYMLAGL